MAMKKEDFADHQQRYQALMAQALASERAGMYEAVIENAVAAWPYIDGMMEFEKRWGQGEEFNSVPAVDLVLKYAPLLFDSQSLNKLDGLLQERRRIEKNTSESLCDKLAAARDRMWAAHRLWNHIEDEPSCRQDDLRKCLGGDQNEWRAMAEAWEKMGLLRRMPEGSSYRLALSTRMGELVGAKCPACGHLDRAPKAMCLEEATCPECSKSVSFVILSSCPGSAEG